MIIKPIEADETEVIDQTKIFYCSRTHSQLIQFANEVRRVKVPSSVSTREPGLANDPESPEIEEIKHLSLGSRKNLCINPNVMRLESATAVNEKCLDLQQPGTAAGLKCQFLPTKDNETLVKDFRDHTMAKVRDIEDLATLGKKLCICPYYASRATIKPSEARAAVHC